MRVPLYRNIICLSLFFLFYHTGYSQDLDSLDRENPVKLSGSASLGSSAYGVTGIDPRQKAYGYQLMLNPTLDIYDWKIPFTLIVSEQGDQFSQPFRRFGISPEYKSMKMHLGYSRMSFSPFVLNGQSFNGAGIELTPGNFRFSAFHGRLKKASATVTDNIFEPQFKQTAWGGKIGVGTEDGYLDLILFKAHDHVSSLSDISDSLSRSISAYENLVFGVSNKISFVPKKLVWKTDFAGSAFTHDIRAQKVDQDEMRIPDFLYGLFTPYYTSQLTWAGKSSLTLSLDDFSLGASYRRVNPNYRSLGINYINDDLQNITMNASFSLFKRKMNISGRYGVQYNNLDNRQVSKTNRNIGSISIGLNPAPVFGLSLRYSNFSIDQVTVKDTMIVDSLLVNHVSHNFNVMPRFTFISEQYIHSVVLNYTYQQLNDKYYANNIITNGNFNYGITFRELDLNCNGGLNYHTMERDTLSSGQYGFSLSGRKQFFDRKLSLQLNESLNLMESSFTSGSVNNLSLYASYRITSRQRLYFRLTRISSNLSHNDFTETKGRLGYNIRF